LTSDESFPAIGRVFRSVGLDAFAIAGRDLIEELGASSDPVASGLYGLSSAAGAVVAAFPYDPYGGFDPGDAQDEGARDAEDRDAEDRDAGARLEIGAFAAANRYAALARLLRAAGRALSAEAGLPAAGFRSIVNSRLSEKRLASMAGLGFIGRSSLLVTEAYGPACVLGALTLPPGFPLGTPARDAAGGAVEAPRRVGLPARLTPGGGCGSCRACAEACPTGAIDRADGGPDLARCIQYWTARPGDVPEPVRAAWGRRLYGCDACVAACPRSAAASSPGEGGQSPAERAEALLEPAERRPGRLVPASLFGSGDDGEIRAFLRKTALGMSWIGPAELRRNAAIADGQARYRI